MKYNVSFQCPAVGQMFEKKGVNPFDEPVIYEIKEERNDNTGIKWFHLESNHEHIYLPYYDLLNNFMEIKEL